MKSSKPNYYSTWDFINSYNEKKSKGTLHKNESLLEKDFSLLVRNSDKDYYKEDFIFQQGNKSPVESFLTYFEIGLYPPPSIMAAIAESFNEYYFRKGDSTLEECFFGSSTKAVGNNSSLSDREFKFQYMFVTLNDETEKLSQIDAAEKVITELKLECDVETFLRQYRRYKKKKDCLDISEIKKKFK
jgi:hypothetical protein